METILLSGNKAAGRVTLIDDDDFGVVSQFRWHVQEKVTRTGSICGPYAVTRVLVAPGKYQTLGLHRLITGWPMTDHINHDGLDNRRENLRPATVSQNGANRRPGTGGTSVFKGVSWDRHWNHWVARVRIDGRAKFLGTFRDEHAAARAYDAAALAAFGEYACLNFPGHHQDTRSSCR